MDTQVFKAEVVEETKIFLGEGQNLIKASLFNLIVISQNPERAVHCEELINITEIKKRFVEYRADYPFDDIFTHRVRLSKIIDRIDCEKDNLKIRFQGIPKKEGFDI